jgi:uncharacterized membrane protein
MTDERDLLAGRGRLHLSDVVVETLQLVVVDDVLISYLSNSKFSRTVNSFGTTAAFTQGSRSPGP